MRTFGLESGFNPILDTALLRGRASKQRGHWTGPLAGDPESATFTPARQQRRDDSTRNQDRKAMRIVIFGLTLSSSWGNGNAAIWRGLCGALARQGHHVAFFEHDQPYYASHRDLTSPDLYQLLLY